jgi:hypothetical protein
VKDRKIGAVCDEAGQGRSQRRGKGSKHLASREGGWGLAWRMVNFRATQNTAMLCM